MQVSELEGLSKSLQPGEGDNGPKLSQSLKGFIHLHLSPDRASLLFIIIRFIQKLHVHIYMLKGSQLND